MHSKASANFLETGRATSNAQHYTPVLSSVLNTENTRLVFEADEIHTLLILAFTCVALKGGALKAR